MIQYIKRNPILKNYKLCLDEEFSITLEDLNKVKDLFGEYNNIYVYVDGNNTPISINEYERTVNAIDEIVNKIKKYNLSPLEQTMYAYDLVRDRVYTKEGTEESSLLSRDLSSVLFGDKIVCVGYANILDKVLSNLGINTLMYYTKRINDASHGHARNIAHIIDHKYEVNGVYYFDTTWDSKRDKSDINYLNSYRFFAKQKEDIEMYDDKFTDKTFEGYSEEFIWEFEDMVKERGIQNVPKNMIRTINEVSMFIDNKNIIDTKLYAKYLPDSMKPSFDLDKTMDKLNDYRELFFESEISTETLLQVLYNVRKVEYYENPKKYKLELETFKSALRNSNWDIEDAGMRFMEVLFGRHVIADKNQVSEYIDKYSENNDLERNIERVKLTRTLKEIVNKR